MIWTLVAIFLPALLFVGWLGRRLGTVSSWGALAGAGITTFLPSYFPIGSVALLTRTGQFLLQTGLDKESHPYASRFVEAFLSAAIPEEVYKFVVLLLLCRWAGKVKTVQEGILLGAIVGVGHALGENCQDMAEGVRGALISGVLKLIYLGSLGIGMGFLVGRRQTQGVSARPSLAKALLIPLTLHGLFDFGYFVGELAEPYAEKDLPAPILLGMGVMFVAWAVPIAWAWRIVRKNAVRKPVAKA